MRGYHFLIVGTVVCRELIYISLQGIGFKYFSLFPVTVTESQLFFKGYPTLLVSIYYYIYIFNY